MKITRSTSMLPVIICGIITILIFQEKIPLSLGSIVLLIVTTLLGIIYQKKRIYVYGYWGASISLFFFILGGIIFGFDNIFPSMGIFFYIGYSISLLLRILFFYPVNYNKKGKYLIGINGLIHLIAALVSYLLLPSPLYLIIPACLIIISSIITGILLNKLYLLEKKVSWSFKLPVVVLIPVTVLGFIFIMLDTGYKKIELSQNEIIEVNLLIDKAETLDHLDGYLDVGRWYFNKSLIAESEKWFFEIQDKWPDDVISLGYLAAILGVKSRDAKNPNTKMAYAEESIKEMDNLVEKYPGNLEIRFIRAMYYSQLPSVFRRKSYVFNDLEYILLYEKLDNPLFKLAYNLLESIPGGYGVIEQIKILEQVELLDSKN